MSELIHSIVPSPLGPLLLAADEEGLVHMLFEREERHIDTRGSDGLARPEHPVLREAADQLAAYFAGSLTRFSLPLAPRSRDKVAMLHLLPSRKAARRVLAAALSAADASGAVALGSVVVCATGARSVGPRG